MELKDSLRHTSEHGCAAGTWANQLQAYFSNCTGAIVAYSGGLDSGLLAYAAHRALGDRMIAVLADSLSLSRREYHFALNFARKHGIPLRIIQTDEMENPHYRANAANRCYFCKQTLFQQIAQLQKKLIDTRDEGGWPVFYGVNLDDLGDFRPGMQAAQEASIRAPFVELGMDKRAIRTICFHYGLEIADKPAMPCLASRIAYGEPLTAEKLRQVEAAEDFLLRIGLRVLRVRHHGSMARIEVRAEDFGLVLENRATITKRFNALGFAYVALDLDGFRSGSMNAMLQRS
jgi:pyridinium-3,5-biscarboxylic acid mononucleotide sulfurtransferase